MTPEDDLTPEEINDPELMQLWLAPCGTPLPASWDGSVDVAFRFVGMVERELKPRFRGTSPVDALGLYRVEPREPAGLTLTWRRLLRKHAIFLPVGSYCSAIFGMPAERALGVAPRVALRGFDVDVDGAASCTAVLEFAEPYRTSLEWYVGPKVFA